MRHEFHSYVGHCFIKPRSFKTSNDVSHGWCSSCHQSGFMSPSGLSSPPQASSRWPEKRMKDSVSRLCGVDRKQWQTGQVYKGYPVHSSPSMNVKRERKKIKIHSLWPKKKKNLHPPFFNDPNDIMWTWDGQVYKRDCAWCTGWISENEWMADWQKQSDPFWMALGWKQALIS